MIRTKPLIWIAMLALTTSLVGCNEGQKKSAHDQPTADGGDLGKPAPSAATKSDGSVWTPVSAAPPAQKTGSVFSAANSAALNAEASHGHEFPPARPQLAPPVKAEDASPAPAKTWGETFARTKSAAAGYAGSAYDHAAKVINHSADYVADVAGPSNGEQRSRVEALKETRDHGDQYRNLSPDDLKHTLDRVSPNADAIKTVLRSRSDNDVIKYLSRFLTETDANRAASNSARLIADVFEDPEYTPSKLAEVAFDLGAIAKGGYYDEAVAGRVAFLQAQVDQSAKRDRMTGYLKDALFLAVPAVGAYALVGSRAEVIDTTTKTLRSIRVGKILSDGRSAARSTYSRAAGAFTGVGRNLVGAARKSRLKTPEAVKEELKLLGFTETELTRDWDLITPTRSDVAFLGGTDVRPNSVSLKWHQTNRDRLDFAVSDHWDGPIPDDKQVLFFRIHRGINPNAMVVSAKFDKDYVTKVAERLERTTDRAFLTMVDEGGNASQSTIRTEKLLDAEDATIGASPAPRAERLGPTPETPKFAARQPLPEVEPKPAFDHLRGAIAMATTGALTVTPTIMGYASGERDGRDYENQYLERQVDRRARPPETVVSDLNKQ